MCLYLNYYHFTFFSASNLKFDEREREGERESWLASDWVGGFHGIRFSGCPMSSNHLSGLT